MKYKLTYFISMLCYCGLLMTLVVWHLMISPPYPASPLMIVSIQLLPLLLPLYWLANKNIYAFKVSCFLVMFYFIQGINSIFAQSDAWAFGACLAGFSALYFIVAIVYIRQSHKQQ